MEISLVDVNHKEEKAYIEFRSESVNANVTFTISDLNVMEDLIKSIRTILTEESIRTILTEGKKDDER